jgi:alpha-glucosidase (family GH31 glycosyl hydrolase)
MLERIYQKMNLSGIWLDMNEPMSFCNGPCEMPEEKSEFDYTNDLPYVPGCDGIETFTTSLNGTHFGGWT